MRFQHTKRDKEPSQKASHKILLLFLVCTLAAFLAFFVFYTSQSGLEIRKSTVGEASSGSGAESSDAQAEAVSQTKKNAVSSSRASAKSKKTSSAASGSESETSQTLPPEFSGEAATVAGTESDFSSGSDEPDTSESLSFSADGFTLLCTDESLADWANLWRECAQNTGLFEELLARGYAVTISLAPGDGALPLEQESGFSFLCACSGEASAKQIYAHLGQILDAVLASLEQLSASQVRFCSYNPIGFCYGQTESAYVGTYFLSEEAQLSLEEDRREVWAVFFSGESVSGGRIQKKLEALREDYEFIFQ